jgi:hypothetical protein
MQDELEKIREIFGHGSREDLWPPGLSLSEAVAELVRELDNLRNPPVSAGDGDLKELANPTHYDFAIKPIDAIEAWNMNFSRGCVVKYLARAPYKGTELDDLVKARDYLDREVARMRART